MVVANTRGNLV